FQKVDLVPTMGYFFTMNPGYSGRQELPENLKVLFRGVTMMAPNRESIIRVKLCSYGFEKADDIAAKFRKLYELCEAQLSKQTHYDFGLRNILSVLRHGGNEKKKFKEDVEKEEELIYTALRNMNLSKFVPDDKPLFESLIRDVFPEQKNTKEKTYPELEAMINKLLTEQNLSTLEQWVHKIVQTYETYNVRHGFMIVGTTGTGKTTIMNTLTTALQKLSNDKDIFKIYRLNPKAVEDQNLFIEKFGDQYIMGTFTEIWSKCNSNSSSYSKQNNWVVCDGPIDSLWIENLNTVLDDNKILTLSNNERIAMSDTCRLVMEVENVKNASLATVSRCGMIYITERDITQKPLLDAWSLRHKATKEISKELITAFDAFFPKFINADTENHFIKNFTPCINMSWLIKVKNFLLLIDCLIRSADKASLANIQKFTYQASAFAFAWAFGSIFEGPERVKFHKYMRDGLKFGNYIPEVKEDMTIFEYQLTNEWVPWETEKAEITSENLSNFSSLLIPTMDSTRANYLIDKMNSRAGEGSGAENAAIPVLIIGDSGTSKTSTVLIYARTFNADNKKALKRVNFSSATRPSNFQQTIDDELEKNGNEYQPSQDRNLVAFLDDISMPYVNKWGDQVTLELVRQLLEFSGYYFISTT
ncbi:MAG: hypothetical protein MJ252_28180, partial [archaeon]|nr:hypothetical protein [archaeon]